MNSLNSLGFASSNLLEKEKEGIPNIIGNIEEEDYQLVDDDF
jgi:hypothetical protein